MSPRLVSLGPSILTVFAGMIICSATEPGCTPNFSRLENLSPAENRRELAASFACLRLWDDPLERDEKWLEKVQLSYKG
jgi:hypothetical protein